MQEAAEDNFKIPADPRPAYMIALDEINAACGYSDWEYPGQITRAVLELVARNAGLQADYDSRMEDLQEADKRIAELEAFIVAEVDPFSLRPARREKWYDLHKKLHPENYR